MIEDIVRGSAHGVGDQHLFAQAGNEPAQTEGDAAGVHSPVVDLVGHILIADDRACDQLGEEGDVQKNLKIVSLDRHILPIDIDHIAQGLEGEEGDADGQADGRHRQAETQEGIHIGHEEACVLKYAQKAQVHGNSQNQDHLAAIAAQKQRKEVVQQGAYDHQNDVDRLAVSIEQKACNQKQDISDPSVGDHRVQDQHNRQKNT